MIQIIFIFIFIIVIIALVIIYFILKKVEPRGGIIWDFKKPDSKCTNLLLKSLLSKQKYTGRRPSNTILNMKIRPNSNTFNKLRNSKDIIRRDTPIPNNFSWRHKGGDMIENVRDQEGCGGCWAFAITSCMGDRIAIKNKIKAPYPSVTYLLSECSIPSNKSCATNQGCDGANVYYILQWLIKNSENALETCWPYKIIENSLSYGAPSNYLAPSSLKNNNLDNCCYNCCYDDNSKINISKPSFSIKNGTIQYFGEPINGNKQYTQDIIDDIIYDIQIDIMNNGPVVTSFVVLENFETFYNTNPSTAIYSNTNVIMDIDGCEFNDCSNLGYTNDGHAVCITGWGIENGQKYWEVRNSWGEEWADKGYCKIAFTDINNLKYYIGIDIPIISNTNDEYFGGVTSFIPNDIENLNEMINKGIFKKSNNII